MSLQDTTLSLFAFKNLLNKSMTDPDKGLGNEAEGIFLNVHAASVFSEEIDEDPAVAVSDNIAEEVIADLVVDNTSNGKAFFAVYPTGHPNAGERVRNAIPTVYGNGYEAIPYDGNDDPISVNDARDWVYQYNSGIFFQQTSNALPVPAKLKVYVYTGKLLSDYDLSLIGQGTKYVIEENEEITIPLYFQYFVFGDFTINGNVTNYGQLIVMNGAVIMGDDGTLDNYGDIILVDVATQDPQGFGNLKFSATFTATQDVPLDITHNLGTDDFIISVRDGNKLVEVDITILSINAIRLTSSENIVNGKVNIISMIGA